MCRKVPCTSCEKSTWAGCGLHIESALNGVDEWDRCPAWRTNKNCPGKEPYTTVRPAHEGDLDKVMEIVSEVVPEMNNAGNFQWDSVYPLRINFEEDVKNKNLYVVVEVDKGTENVLGMAALTEDQSPEYADCGWDLTIPAIVTHRMAVDPRAQKKGAASKLFAQADELAIKKGHGLVRIDTNKMNTKMQGAITKAGYEYSGEISLNSKPPEMRFLCYCKQNAVKTCSIY